MVLRIVCFLFFLVMAVATAAGWYTPEDVHRVTLAQVYVVVAILMVMR